MRRSPDKSRMWNRSITPTIESDYIAVAGDIGDPATARRVVDAALEHFGRVDTLVNNAGVFIAKPFTQYTAEDYAAMTATNLSGFFHFTQLAIEAMQKHWFWRKYVNLTNPPPVHPLPASEAPPRKPVPALRTPRDLAR